jgi:hypothetical protein
VFILKKVVKHPDENGIDSIQQQTALNLPWLHLAMQHKLVHFYLYLVDQGCQGKYMTHCCVLLSPEILKNFANENEPLSLKTSSH